MSSSASSPWTPADPEERLTVTFVLRQPAGAADIAERLLSGTFDASSTKRADLAADPADVQAVLSFIAEHGLEVVKQDAAARTVQASGTVQQLDDAFGVSLGAGSAEALHYQGEMKVPAELEDSVIAVLGLDQRAIAKHHDAG